MPSQSPGIPPSPEGLFLSGKTWQEIDGTFTAVVQCSWRGFPFGDQDLFFRGFTDPASCEECLRSKIKEITEAMRLKFLKKVTEH